MHLDNGGNQFSGYRPWHQPGMTITNGTDLGWIGLKDEGGDANHMTIAWADNTAVNGPDLLKAIFLANPGTTGTAGTEDGLETFRVLPAVSGNESFFGVGDFNTPAANPTERLHVTNGTIRIDSLIPDFEGDSLPYMLVADTNGVIHWRDINALNTDCDWQMQGSNDVSTAYPGNTCPPIEENKVRIGLQYPKAKLHVWTHEPSIFTGIGILSQMRNDEEGGWSIMGESRADFTNTFNPNGMRGVVGMAENCKFAIGVAGHGGNTEDSPGQAGFVVGVKGEATAYENADIAIGVWGTARGASNAQDYAAWFDGIGYISSGIWVPSDASLKHNITDLQPDDAVERFMQLEPKRFEFDTELQPHWALPVGEQHGFLIQDLAAMYPHLVKEAIHPAILDTAGEVMAEAAPLMVMNMDGLIPEIVTVVQAQQQRIVEQGAQIAQLLEMISACCSAGGSDGRGMDSPASSATALETDLRIIPNPVADRTELRYTVGQEGRVRLEITDASGRMVQAVDEGARNSGSYSYEWNTTLLAPGTYFCTLYVNDEPLVKKAVKLKVR